MTAPSWPRTDVEQIRDTSSFEEARYQLDARLPSSAASGGLALRREVQPTFSIGQTFPPRPYFMSGINATLGAPGEDGRVLLNVGLKWEEEDWLGRRLAGFSDLFLTSYGVRRKGVSDNSHHFHCVKAAIANNSSGQGNGYVQRDVYDLPIPFLIDPDGGAPWYGGWSHQLARPIPIQSPGATRMLFDVRYDTDASPLVVNAWWVLEYLRETPAQFAGVNVGFFPRTD